MLAERSLQGCCNSACPRQFLQTGLTYVGTAKRLSADTWCIVGCTVGATPALQVWDCRSRNFDPIQTMKVFGDSVMGVAAAEDR